MSASSLRLLTGPPPPIAFTGSYPPQILSETLASLDTLPAFYVKQEIPLDDDLATYPAVPAVTADNISLHCDDLLSQFYPLQTPWDSHPKISSEMRPASPELRPISPVMRPPSAWNTDSTASGSRQSSVGSISPLDTLLRLPDMETHDTGLEYNIGEFSAAPPLPEADLYTGGPSFSKESASLRAQSLDDPVCFPKVGTREIKKEKKTGRLFLRPTIQETVGIEDCRAHTAQAKSVKVVPPMMYPPPPKRQAAEAQISANSRQDEDGDEAMFPVTYPPPLRRQAALAAEARISVSSGEDIQEPLVKKYPSTEDCAPSSKRPREVEDKDEGENRASHSKKRKISAKEVYSCPVCQKSFSRSYDLTRHLSIHNGSEKWMCQFCCKFFCRRDALDRHIRETCPQNPDSRKASKPRRSSRRPRA